ncbi:MAG: FHA domain-containing protein [Muribaculaceae bacterium]|nr:FHA domain-containing protein [Muribaculaceae bacterium]
MDQESNKELAQARVKTVVCDNCGKELTVRMPSKPGRYKFTCPHCHNKVSFEVKAASDEAERKVLKSDILDDRVISRRIPNEKQPNGMDSPPANASEVKKNPYANIPVLGMPIVPPGKGCYQIIEKAKVNTQYRFECPGCSKDIVVMPRVAGKLIKVKCSKCGTIVLYSSAGEAQATPAKVDVKQPPAPQRPKQVTPPTQDEDDGPATVLLNTGGGFGGVSRRGRHVYAPQARPGAHLAGPGIPPPPVVGVPTPPARQGIMPPPVPGGPPPFPPSSNAPISNTKPKGMLSWKSGSPISRASIYRLIPGRNTIGRYDPDYPSDVMISGDDEMSRQSVEITAMFKPNLYDYTYELRIIRSTNNVYVNSRPVSNNQTVQLNYGDTICMGKTIISFVKANDDK